MTQSPVLGGLSSTSPSLQKQLTSFGRQPGQGERAQSEDLETSHDLGGSACSLILIVLNYRNSRDWLRLARGSEPGIGFSSRLVRRNRSPRTTRRLT